jgi:hypothetical protein
VRSSTTIALRHLYSLAEITNLRGDGEVEVRQRRAAERFRSEPRELLLGHHEFLDELLAVHQTKWGWGT